MYLGFVIALAGIAALLGTVSPWLSPVAFFALAAGWYIPFEERACRERFGAAYDAYCARTRRWV
jgi:protein-S-isoprenylcysteine O-methyltransferase Ste14